MWLIFAIFSADSPMVSPVVGSAIAGVIGMRSRGRIRVTALARAPNDFAREAATSASAKPREWRTGTVDRDSAPPAIAQSAWPSRIWSAASVIAWLADAQARETVHDCTPLGRCGIRDTSRAMLGASTDGTTVPNTSRSTSVLSTPVRWMSSATTARPRSIADIALRTVPARANGVRRPATIATRRPLTDSGAGWDMVQN